MNKCCHLRLLFVCLLFSLMGCNRQPPRAITPAFYYWRTTFACSPAERACLDSLDCKKIYLKTLDIGRDPVTGLISSFSQLNISDSSALRGFCVVPTVFITNEVFKSISKEEMAQVVALAARSPLQQKSGEVQFDCDWTPSTREAYFLFLRNIKASLLPGAHISATIRLHQYKFPKQTGVPPVDRGMLMLYNTGDIDDPETRNSIFDPEDAQKYLLGAPKQYPLPLDIALPLFSWALVYREGAFWKILPELSETELDDTLCFEKISAAPLWRLKKGTYRSGHYLRPGDQIRLESISPALLRQAAVIAAKTSLADDATLAFFHLDTFFLRRCSAQLLDSVCQTVQSGRQQR